MAKPRLAITLAVIDNDPNYLIIEARVHEEYVRTDGHGSRWYAAGYQDGHCESLGWVGVRGQASFDSDRPGGATEFYGYHVELKSDGLTTHQVKAVAKTMGGIDRKMARYEEEDGSVDGLGRFLLRFAKATGAKVIRRKHPDPANAWNIDDDGMQELPANHVIGVVADLHAAWVDKLSNMGRMGDVSEKEVA